MQQILQRITAKKQQLDSLRPLPPELEKNLDDWYRIELTYTSNAIEGNTLTRQETALVVEKGLTIEGKTLNEQLEAKNHAAAYNFVKQLSKDKPERKSLTESVILEIHKIFLSGIDDVNAGKYRNVAVRIAGSDIVLPNPVKVPELMTEFHHWLVSENQDHPAKIAADAHFKLVTIHPFTDGNGRTARLLMNLLLLQAGYAPAIIKAQDRKAYIDAVYQGQRNNKLNDYYQVIYQAVERSLDEYLKVAGQTVNN